MREHGTSYGLLNISAFEIANISYETSSAFNVENGIGVSHSWRFDEIPPLGQKINHKITLTSLPKYLFALIFWYDERIKVHTRKISSLKDINYFYGNSKW